MSKLKIWCIHKILYTIVMKNRFYTIITNKFLRAFQLQLYLTLVGAPILIWWGIPLSIASPVGNILFHPLLTLFLLCASMIFFCEIFCIPHAILIILFEKISDLFHYCVSWGQQDFLVGFARPPLFLLLLVPFSVVVIFCWKKTRSTSRSIVALLVLSCLWSVCFKYWTIQPTIKYIPCNRGVLYLAQSQGNIVLIDPGFLGQRISAPSFVEFTLVPEIIRTMGTSTLDTIIILQPSQTTFDAVRQLAECCCIKSLYIPYWHGSLTKGQARSYARLCEIVSRFKIRVIRLKNYKEIYLGPDRLFVETLPSIVRSKAMQYPVMKITGTIGGYVIKACSCKKIKTIRI